MTFALDPQVVTALAPMTAAMAATIPPPAGDVQSGRPVLGRHRGADGGATTDVDRRNGHGLSNPAGDGAQILLRWYAKTGAAPVSAVLYLHGGGTISDSGALYDGPVSRYVSNSGVPMLSVDYRLALNVDPTRIGIMGDSAGGGLAAA